MRLLVTRPRPDADATKERLERAGHEVLVAPLLEIVPRIPPAGFPGPDVQAFLVTSANGARALADAVSDRATPVFAVGAASAQVAREAGFRHVESADGDVAALASLLRARLRPEGGCLVHAVGSVSAGNLVADLTESGFDACAHVLYEAMACDELPEPIAAALRGRDLRGALFYSPRTARTFLKLVEKANLTPKLRVLTAFCLSHAVAAELAAAEFGGVRVAERPEQDALLRAIEAYGRGHA
ncbi:MAG: uroporphyrinogen-III synthase [Alphaproteobacteria bacterium]|nr:uroporphyrinogen-III synthase [Alphaproteobacteria bacterium]